MTGRSENHSGYCPRGDTDMLRPRDPSASPWLPVIGLQTVGSKRGKDTQGRVPRFVTAATTTQERKRSLPLHLGGRGRGPNYPQAQLLL